MDEELRVLAPMSLGEILDEAISLYRKNFVTFFGIALAPGILTAALIMLLLPQAANLDALFGSVGTQYTTQDIIDMLPAAGAVLLLSFLAGLFAYVALVKAVADRYLDRKASIASSFGFILPRFLPYLGTLIVLVLLFLAASLPGIIPLGLIVVVILYFMLLFMSVFLSQVFVIEDERYFSAFKRSRELAKQNWGRIFLIFILWVVVTWIISFGTMMLLGSFMIAQPVMAMFIDQIVNALILPVLLTSYVLLYFDIRVRKEGFDLQLLAEELAARGAPPSTFPPRTDEPATGTGSQ